MTEELIGRGRDCDVFAAGPDRVVRRNRAGRSAETEALTMRHCAAHGYPVPEVFDAAGPDIVMQRLDGPTMLGDLSARPWTMRSKAKLLADLIDRLERIPLPGHELPAIVEGGDVLVHLDLHPDNVVLTAGRSLFLRGFLSAIDRDVAVASLSTALQFRLRDPNLSDGERSTMRALVDRVS